MDTVQSLNSAEKLLFLRLIENGNDLEMGVKMMAMWKWLVSRGFHEMILKINSRNDQFLASISAEAQAILDHISSPNSKITAASPDRIFPLTSGLADDPSASLIKIFPRKLEEVWNGVQELCVVLRKKLTESLKEKGSAVQVYKTKTGEERNEKWLRDQLNPNAKEWNPIEDSAPEEDRCLFLTFSNGYPLAEHQIVNFFTRKYGACIERVYVHHAEGRNEAALFGKVVFTASSIPAIILGGKQEAKFCVDRRTLWCKKYDSSRTRRFRTSASSSSPPPRLSTQFNSN